MGGTSFSVFHLSGLNSVGLGPQIAGDMLITNLEKWMIVSLGMKMSS